MLAPFAFVLVAQAPSSPRPMSLSDAVDVLGRAGYALALTDRHNEKGTLTRGARRAQVVVLDGGSYSAAMRMGPGTYVLQLSTEFDVARELPLVPHDPVRFDLLPPGRIVFEPSLGRSVTAHADMVVDRRSTSQSAKADLDRYFAALESYARAHGGTGSPSVGRDWRRRPLSESVLLSHPDAPSVDRLLRGWGYAPAPRDFARRGELLTEVRIEGTSVLVSGTEPDAISLTTEVPTRKGPSLRRWMRGAKTGERTATDFDSMRMCVSERVPLAPPPEREGSPKTASRLRAGRQGLGAVGTRGTADGPTSWSGRSSGAAGACATPRGGHPFGITMTDALENNEGQGP